MQLKQVPQDFIVDEIYDLEIFKNKDENKQYFYFILTKKNYTVMKAIEIVARFFNTSRKLIHFAGTKDKVGITSQIISIYGIKKENLYKNLDFLNEKQEDLKLKYIGEFNGRINLGDNLGNAFTIIVRDLKKVEIQKIRKNILTASCRQAAVKNKFEFLNFFDSQRFGYANNSHIIGKYILKNEVENAVKEILTSLPPNPKEEHINFVNEIKENWIEIKNQNRETLCKHSLTKAYELCETNSLKIGKIILLCPQFLRDEKKILEHLIKAKNDFPGAFRRIHKKIRTLYVNAYQSYIFNELIKNKDINSKYNELELVHSQINLDNELGKEIKKLLEKDELNLENFKLKSMPELKLSSVFRKIKIFPKNLEAFKEEKDELNENKLKLKIKFKLGTGEYATNVVKQLFEKTL